MLTSAYATSAYADMQHTGAPVRADMQIDAGSAVGGTSFLVKLSCLRLLSVLYVQSMLYVSRGAAGYYDCGLPAEPPGNLRSHFI
jgi:hypothetical protein